jgi:hypothetical protein
MGPSITSPEIVQCFLKVLLRAMTVQTSDFTDRVSAGIRLQHNDLMRRFSARRVAGRKLLTPLFELSSAK